MMGITRFCQKDTNHPCPLLEKRRESVLTDAEK
jgi:hypothetical protein